MRRISLGLLSIVISVLIISLSNSIGEARGKLIHAFADGAPDDPPGGSANIPNPLGVAVDSAGNIYVAESNQNKVFKIDVSGNLTVVAGTGAPGFSGDGGPAANAQLNSPAGVAVDMAGNLYIADEANQVIRMVNTGNTLITPPSGNIQPGNIATVAGIGALGYGGDGTAATMAELNNPSGVALDSTGNLYIADQGNQRIRRVDAVTGNISTVAGTGASGFSGDGGPAASAQLNSPVGVAVDMDGNLYIADEANQVIRMVNTGNTLITPPSGNIQPGNIATVAGIGAPGYDQDGIPATTAELNNPSGVALDSTGNLYIADQGNQRIRRVDAATGNISTAAGTGTAGYNQDGIAATTAELNSPSAVALDGSGNFYVADAGNQIIRVVSTQTGPTTIAGVTIESGNIATIAVLTHFEVSAPTTANVGSSVNFTVSALDPNGSIVTGYSGTIHFMSGDTSAVLPSDTGLTNGTATFPVTFGTAGTQTITATDVTTSLINGLSDQIAVDSAPSFTSNTSAVFAAGTASSFSITTTGSPVPSLSESSPLPTGITFVDNGDGTGTLGDTPGPGTGGVYGLTFQATNSVGNVSENFTLTVNEAPSVTSPAATSFTVGISGSFPSAASGYPAPSLALTGTLPAGLTFSAGTLSGTPAAGTGGIYSSLLITATNSIGSVSQPFTLTVVQPAVGSINATAGTPQSALVNTTYESPFQVTVLDINGYPVKGSLVTFTVPSSGPGGAFAGGVNTATTNTQGVATAPSFTANGTGGSYTVNAMVAGVSTPAAFSLTNTQAPLFTSANAATFTVGTQQSFSVTATGFPSPTVTESGSLPSGLSFSAGVLSGTPLAGTGGTYTISFTASNSLSMATQTFTLTVNQAPAITSANAATFTVGTQQSFSVTATGFPSPTVTESGALPSGLSFSAGTISGTPLAGTGGTYTISFTASNSLSMVTQTFTLTVNQAPAITSANAATFTVGTQQSFSVTATGFPAPTVTESGALPSGLSFSAGVLSGTPAVGTNSTYNLSFTVSNAAGIVAQSFTLLVLPPPISVSITPLNETLYGGQSQQFTATVLNTANQAVVWSIQPITGNISTAGLYTAPSSITISQNVTVFATSVADITKSAMATITLLPPVAVSITPVNAVMRQGQVQQFTPTVLNAPNTLVSASVATVPTVNYDNNRTGANLGEAVLTPANVASSLSRLGSFAVDGYIYAQPLFVGQVTLSDGSTHDLLIVSTMNNSVYAFDANNPGSSPLWSTNFGFTFGAPPNNQLLYSPSGAGIVSTPVIDVVNKLIYVVHAAPSPAWVLAKLDLTTGNVLGTSTITGQVTGTGDSGDLTSGTNLVFYPRYELQRPGLALANGRVYIAFGSWGDNRPQHGWIFAYDAVALTQKAVICLSPNSWGAPVWQSGGGLAVDSSGNLYVATGNGAGTTDFSEAMIKLDPNLNIVDWFKPSNWIAMSIADRDFSGRAILVPGTNLLIAGAKDHNLYGIDPTNLGGLGGSPQVISDLGTSWGIYSGAVFNGRVYSGDGSIFANLINGATISSFTTSTVNTYAQPVTLSGSCNGTANCIVWSTTVPSSAADGPYPATLRAFDATTLVELYNSDKAPNGADALGHLAKFVPPVVVNGRVYVANQDNLVQVYGVPLATAPPQSTITGTSVNWLITPNVGTISSAGMYTAPGSITTSQTVTVTAISMADWTKSASSTITLTPGPPQVPLASITVAPANPTINNGAKQQFTATGIYQDSSTQDVSSQVTWNSSNTTVATINGVGLATGQTVGNSNVTASLSGVTSNTSVLTVQPVVCPCTIWSSSVVPTVVDSGAGAAVELGVKFRADNNGTITGIRFYKSSANTGTHIGNLWSSTGTLMATATFTSETGSGWQQVNFSSPVAITANTVYVASYHTSVSHFSLDLNTFTSAGVDTPPLHALQTGVSGGNGVYGYSSTSIFPTNSYSGSNYWVDVVFSNTPSSPLASITVAPANPTINTGANQQFTATGTYQDSSTQDISSQVTWNSSNATAATISSTGLATGQAVGSSNISATLSGITSNTAALTVQAAPPPTCPCTIWSSSAVPTTVDSGAGSGVELGVKFRSDSSGTITGIRFYKSSANTGTHIGNLWSSTGTLLATATFTGETASGWQQVNFSSPVTITANTVYVASYFTSVSHFSLNLNAFTSAGVDNAPLHALQTGVSGGNGVYGYNSTSIFPTSTYSGSNYWVDVVFSNTVSSPLASIAVTPASPTVNVGANQQFVATGTYQDSSTQNISSQVTWNSTNTAAATISSAGLATGLAVGSSNISATLSGITSNTAALTVQAAPPPTCPCTIWSSSAVPTTVDSGAGSGVELGVKFTADSSGTITGIRFYKSSANTGTHIGNLWSSTGTLLATATFTNETSSGWQQVNFSHAVGITANTVYVASYHTSVSHFSLNSSAFATAGVDAPPLHALSNAAGGGNGVYLYGSTSAFPTSTYSATNYWVDVVFSTAAASPLASITVAPANPTINTGANQQFTATGTYQDSSTQDISSQVTWNSSNTTAATITSAGLAAGQSAGSSNITATLNGITSNAAVLTVEPLVSIAISPNNPMVALGGTQLFTATGTYQGGSTQSLTPTTWSSSNTAVATINNAGLATVLASGTTTISATLGTITGGTLLTVPSPISITVAPANPTINMGTSQQFTATGTYQNGSTQDISTQVAWNSTNTTAATINSVGLATGQSVGSTTISAALSSITSNAAALTVQPVVCPCTIWSSSAVPTTVDSGAGSGVELGVKFTADSSGTITGIRFYKSSANTGTHIGNLWSSTGTLLATATFTNETSSGWQQVNFSHAVGITANTVYVASYHTNVSHFSLNSSAFATAGVDAPPLHALSNAAGGGNGVYLYGSTSAFPTSTYSATNYWVDVVFSTAAASPLASITVAPANPTINTGANQQFTATGTYQDSSTQDISSQVTWNSSNTTTATINTAGLAAGQSVGNSNITATLNGITSNIAVLTVQPAVCPCTIWSSSAVPTVVDSGAGASVEVGVKFRSDTSGNITGIRFYKSSTNTGTHVGNLWSSTGTLLATATFTNETSSGWQQVNFSSPVAITANTVYVASYHTSVSHFSLNSGAFATVGVDTPPLHALANGVSGGDGVYLYGSTSGFPSNTYNAPNYWVDIVFQ